MEQNINLFPNPPKHYKNFTKENAMPLPDLGQLSKITTFMSFGKSYDTKQNINNFTIQVELDSLKCYDISTIENKHIPHLKLFQEIATNSNFDLSDLNINIFDAIKIEMDYLKKTYLELLSYINDNIDECELCNIIIKFSFQKIYYFISLLKKKQIFIEISNYFKSEIENNTTLENTLSSNLEKCQVTLQDGLRSIKDELYSSEIN